MIPDSMKSLRQWCNWRYVDRDGAATKVPFQPSGKPAKSNDQTTWASFGDVGKAGQFIGFFLADDWFGIDLDECLIDGELLPWAAEIIERFPGAYVEVSPSGRGVKLFCRGLPAGGIVGRKKKIIEPIPGGKSRAIEMYATGRFFTVTGEALQSVEPGDCSSGFAWIRDRYFQAKPTQPATATPIQHRPGCDAERRAIAYLERMPAAVQGQNGSAALMNAARAVVYGFNLGQDRGLTLLESHYNPRCEPPWSDRELAHKCADADAKEFSKPRGWLLDTAGQHGEIDDSWIDRMTDGPTTTTGDVWPDIAPLDEEPEAPAFPLDVLPESLARLCREIAAAMNCPVDFPGVFLIALASGAIAYSRRLRIKASYEQSAALFVAVVGEPGSGKTPALSFLARPLESAQQEMLADHSDLMAAWDAKPSLERGPRPKPRRCVVGDTTTESLGLTLADNPRGVCLIRDELSGFILGMNQYKGGKGSDRQFFLSAWSNTPIVIDRKGDAVRTGSPTAVADPFVTIVGGIQPAVVGQLRGEPGKAIDDGFIDRFLVSYPEPLPLKGESWDDIPPESSATWEAIVAKLLALDNQPTTDNLMPGVVTLTVRGRAAWKQFTDTHAAEMNSPDFPPHLRGPFVKLGAYAGRLALVVHLLRWAAGETACEDVDGESVARAWKLASYFKGHLRKLHHFMGDDPKHAELRKVLAWIKRAGAASFTVRDIHQNLRKTFDHESMTDVLRLAQKFGFIRRAKEPETGRPGPRSERYDVNPAILI